MLVMSPYQNKQEFVTLAVCKNIVKQFVCMVFFKSNATDTNYFTIFLQTANVALAFSKSLL